MADSWWSGWDSGDGTDADAGSAAQSERFVLDELKDSTSASQPTNERGWKLRGTEARQYNWLMASLEFSSRMAAADPVLRNEPKFVDDVGAIFYDPRAPDPAACAKLAALRHVGLDEVLRRAGTRATVGAADDGAAQPPMWPDGNPAHLEQCEVQLLDEAEYMASVLRGEQGPRDRKAQQDMPELSTKPPIWMPDLVADTSCVLRSVIEVMVDSAIQAEYTDSGASATRATTGSHRASNSSDATAVSGLRLSNSAVRDLDWESVLAAAQKVGANGGVSAAALARAKQRSTALFAQATDNGPGPPTNPAKPRVVARSIPRGYPTTLLSRFGDLVEAGAANAGFTKLVRAEHDFAAQDNFRGSRSFRRGALMLVRPNQSNKHWWKSNHGFVAAMYVSVVGDAEKTLLEKDLALARAGSNGKREPPRCPTPGCDGTGNRVRGYKCHTSAARCPNIDRSRAAVAKARSSALQAAREANRYIRPESGASPVDPQSFFEAHGRAMLAELGMSPQKRRPRRFPDRVKREPRYKSAAIVVDSSDAGSSDEVNRCGPVSEETRAALSSNVKVRHNPDRAVERQTTNNPDRAVEQQTTNNPDRAVERMMSSSASAPPPRAMHRRNSSPESFTFSSSSSGSPPPPPPLQLTPQGSRTGSDKRFDAQLSTDASKNRMSPFTSRVLVETDTDSDYAEPLKSAEGPPVSDRHVGTDGVAATASSAPSPSPRPGARHTASDNQSFSSVGDQDNIGSKRRRVEVKDSRSSSDSSSDSSTSVSTGDSEFWRDD